MNKVLSLTFLIIIVCACGNDKNLDKSDNTTMNSYDVYHDEKKYSQLSFKSGTYDNGKDKQVHIILNHGTKGVTVWRSVIEKKITTHNDFTEKNLVIKKIPELGLLEVYEPNETNDFRDYFKQDENTSLNFDNYIGTCSDMKNINGGINCTISLRLGDLSGELSYDKTELQHFDELYKKTKKIVANYLPKHKEKYGKR